MSKVATLVGHNANILVDSLIQLIRDDAIEVQHLYTHLSSLASFLLYLADSLLGDIPVGWDSALESVCLCVSWSHLGN